MKIQGVQVIAEGSGTGGHTVEFIDDTGVVVSLRFPDNHAGVNRTNAVQQAKKYLQRLVQDDVLPDDMTDGENQDGRAATMASSPNSPALRADAKHE
jgi:hypothetical protein